MQATIKSSPDLEIVSFLPGANRREYARVTFAIRGLQLEARLLRSKARPLYGGLYLQPCSKAWSFDSTESHDQVFLFLRTWIAEENRQTDQEQDRRRAQDAIEFIETNIFSRPNKTT